jgi:hypothetical protein
LTNRENKTQKKKKKKKKIQRKKWQSGCDPHPSHQRAYSSSRKAGCNWIENDGKFGGFDNNKVVDTLNSILDVFVVILMMVTFLLIELHNLKESYAHAHVLLAMFLMVTLLSGYN